MTEITRSLRGVAGARGARRAAVENWRITVRATCSMANNLQIPKSSVSPWLAVSSLGVRDLN
eukprot:scaffold147998_cov13-Tisochrysis_lutea.AAC.1